MTGMHLPGSTTSITKISTTSDEEEDAARVVAVKTFAGESTTPHHHPVKLLSKSQIKRRERGEARFARYIAQLNRSGNGVKGVHEVSESVSESESESEDQDEDGASTCSSID